MANLLGTNITGAATISDRIVIGGNFSNNAYNSVSSTRLHFGGGNSDALENYYIGTNLNDYGGNYTKLDLRWHTGIRMGAQPGYGGIRFYDTEDLGTVIFSVGTGDANVRVANTLYINGNTAIHSGGGQTIGGTTYFSGGESMQVYGIRGRFANEYIHLYHKVGIGNPNGWGEGQGSTPGYGLSTYGGATIAYGNSAGMTVYGSITTDSYLYSNYSVRVGEIWGFGGLYRSSGAMLFGTENSGWSFRMANSEKVYIATDGNIWMSWAGDYLSNLLNAKQNASTAITTSNIGSQSVNYATSAGSVAWGNVSGKPSLDYQQEYTFTAPPSPDGSGYVWLRVSMGGFNGGGNFVKFSISRAIGWNGASPYGGPSMDVVAYSREWHGGQDGAVITYGEHGSVPGSGWITNAGPRDLAGGGYWFYMRIWAGVDYAMRVYRGSGPIGTSWEQGADPGNVYGLRPGVNNVGPGYVGLNTNGDIYGSRFYDYNNNGYYLDPASNSNLNDATANQFYANGWFRNYGAQGIYNQSYGTHFYSSTGAAWNITGSGGNIELRFRSNHESTIRGYVYADTSNNIGFLNNGGGWALRTDSSNNAFVYGSNLTIGEGGANATNIVMGDGDEGARTIHCNSNRIGFLNSSGSWGSWCDDSGNWATAGGLEVAGNSSWFGGYGGGSGPGIALENVGTFARFAFWGLDFYDWNNGIQMTINDGYVSAANSFRAPIFYDSNDTRYYVDPDGSSNIVTLTSSNTYVGNAIYFGGGNNYLNWTSGRIHSNVGIKSENSMHAPIFYDSENTAYYLDPASRSNLNMLTLSGAGHFFPNTWTELSGYYGLYSPYNGAHFYPNNASYGSWRIEGTRNGWRGIEFGSGDNGNVNLMISVSSTVSGFHNNSYGWHFRWDAGTLYCHKNTYGGGTQAVVLDSVNLTNYAAPVGIDYTLVVNTDAGQKELVFQKGSLVAVNDV